MLDELLLLSGIDIPFPSAQLTIHQPTLKEIAYINEDYFLFGCELLIFSKDSLTSEDKVELKDKSNFDIIMAIMNDKNNTSFLKSSIGAMMILILLFPKYIISLQKNFISLKKISEDEKESNEEFFINNSNYEEFKNIIVEIFCLKDRIKNDYNPNGDIAQKIADKLRKGAQERAKLKGQSNQKISMFSRYASILAVGESKDLNSLMQYTIYQLMDEFQRYELKINYDLHLQAKMAGAKNLKEVDSWMKDIHE